MLKERERERERLIVDEGASAGGLFWRGCRKFGD